MIDAHARRDLISQWAFDSRPVLGRFHLWLEDVEEHRIAGEPAQDLSFVGTSLERCLIMTAGVTALGTRLFGRWGEGKGLDAAADEPREEGRRRRVGLRHERGALVPHAVPPGEPRDHGLPRRGAHAEGGRDARHGLEPAPRLRPRLRPPLGREVARPARPPLHQRPLLRLEGVLDRARRLAHHGLGRGHRHAREHLPLRQGRADGPDDRPPPLRPAAPDRPPLRGVHGRR